MKTFFASLMLALGLAGNSAMATGALGTDVPQSGVLTFTAVSTTYITNLFAYPFSKVPVITLNALTTNGAPVTNIFVTLTNFAAAAAATNSQVAWQANPGFQRIQYGSNAVQASLLITNTFSPAYAYAPFISIEGSATNAAQGTIAISSISPTSFVIQFGNTNQIVYWSAIGTCATPGSSTITY